MFESLTVNHHTLTWGSRTYIMGILNVTPDSFSGDGLLAGSSGEIDVNSIIDKAREFVHGGADILDVGGESTRPGSQPVDAAEEMRRVLPVIRRLAGELDVHISVDTYRAAVAEEALQAGGPPGNDVGGFKAG